jgi:hypothetical protein
MEPSTFDKIQEKYPFTLDITRFRAMDDIELAAELCDINSIFTTFRNSKNMAGPITGYEKLYLERDLSGAMKRLRASSEITLVQKVESTVNRMAYWYAMYPLLKSSDRVEDQEAADLIVEWMNATVEELWGQEYLEEYDFICRCAVNLDGSYTYCPKPECQQTKKEVEHLNNVYPEYYLDPESEDEPMSPPYEVTTPSYGVDEY